MARRLCQCQIVFIQIFCRRLAQVIAWMDLEISALWNRRKSIRCWFKELRLCLSIQKMGTYFVISPDHRPIHQRPQINMQIVILNKSATILHFVSCFCLDSLGFSAGLFWTQGLWQYSRPFHAVTLLSMIYDIREGTANVCVQSPLNIPAQFLRRGFCCPRETITSDIYDSREREHIYLWKFVPYFSPRIRINITERVDRWNMCVSRRYKVWEDGIFRPSPTHLPHNAIQCDLHALLQKIMFV